MKRDIPKKGSLVFCEDIGSHGLIGLVISKELQNEEGNTNNYIDVYFRGLNGNIISIFQDDNFLTVSENNMDIVEKAVSYGDFYHYKNIAKNNNFEYDSLIYDSLQEEII